MLLITPRQAAAPQVSLERTRTGQIAAAVTLCPDFESTRTPSDVVFLVDRSGSMQGSSIEQVRNALQICLRSLDSGCAFNIVGFGSAFESLFKECRPYDERSLAEASRYVSALEASLGGTEMLPALEFVLEHAAASERLLQLVVLTDGEVTNTDAVIEAVRRRADRVRVFTFGIGRGASHHLVKGMARAGRGAAECVHPGERLEATEWSNDVPPPAAGATTGRPLDRLVALQRADGSWQLDHALADVLGVSLIDLMDRVRGATGDRDEARRAFATALALIFLGRESSSSRAEWDLLAAKAMRWLARAKARPPGGGFWLEFAKGVDVGAS